VPPVPGDTVSARLSRVLEAGGIEPTPERVQRLADLVQWSVDQVILASLPRRPRPPQWRRRPGDPTRAKATKRRGAPPNRDMRGLFANLAMFWLREVGYLPGVRVARVKHPRSLKFSDRHSGPFLAFAQALGAELGPDTRALGTELERTMKIDPDPLYEFATDLSYMAENAPHIRDWLRAACVRKLKRRHWLRATGETVPDE
jgi:hypothetical protein